MHTCIHTYISARACVYTVSTMDQKPKAKAKYKPPKTMAFKTLAQQKYFPYFSTHKILYSFTFHG